jgi:hypothetical protein
MPIVIMDQVEEQVTEAAGDLVEALAPEEKKCKCNEFGTVVVQITVIEVAT